MEFKHISVMLQECLDGLNVKKGGVYFDATLGGGGHTEQILKLSSPDGIVIGTDRDIDAINATTERLKEYKTRLKAVNTNFKNFDNVLDSFNILEVDGILVDLGVSSYQLDNRSRGFSYLSLDETLDMRMDKSQPYSAIDFLNTESEEQIKYVLETYGEERFAYKIAKKVIEARRLKQITKVGELVEICDDSIPFKFRRDTHSAKKTFQAIRIAVNEELDGLENALRQMINRLKKGGRMAVITFHSLEDRIVKTVFKDLATACTCDKRFPCVCGRRQIVKEINKKPITASEEELKLNSRSKCAKLRVIEKL